MNSQAEKPHKAQAHKAEPQDALIKMANEIAFNIAPGKDEKLVAKAVAKHINHFWARSMKEQIINVLETSDHELSPIAIKAIEELKEIRK